MEHYYNTIQNWFDYPEVFKLAIHKAKDNALFVELGVWKGGSTSFMGVEIFNSGKKIEYHAIDSFGGSKEHGDVSDWLYDEASQNLKPLTDIGIVKLIKGYSLEEVKNYKDNSIDFCFIDASHEYADVKLDIEAWLPKVKSGGILAGHDYDVSWQGVIKAVDEIIGKNNISTIGSSFIHYKK
jgi:predicted O-methyltransferase YrrM